ncbi:hypothetical protein RSSM_06651 [Rhodopirellula sallentina SM41]|uniref:Uncharacterized protein n=1 Tax=Rhodopirellula sallentina SM41 TaxID=1263870 RepID=M5TS91_9BACT|nr:hypothetical protein RSSM_06651 [Rhodopirellula sallentina SM41]
MDPTSQFVHQQRSERRQYVRHSAERHRNSPRVSLPPTILPLNSTNSRRG